jgi:hypothetical protein
MFGGSEKGLLPGRDRLELRMELPWRITSSQGWILGVVYFTILGSLLLLRIVAHYISTGIVCNYCANTWSHSPEFPFKLAMDCSRRCRESLVTTICHQPHL